jgi:hypothetical protein
MEVEKSIRYRINISRGMKGQTSFEATVDGVGYTQDQIVFESDSLVQMLEKRYPPQLGG